MRNKVTTAAEAIAVIQDGDALCTFSFVSIGVLDELLLALERRFLEAGEPRGLTVLFTAGQGDRRDCGLNALGHCGSRTANSRQHGRGWQSWRRKPPANQARTG